MRKPTLLLLMLCIGFMQIQAQTLDRISLSAGAATGDTVNFVLGETFNFAIAKDGDISLETGSLSSEENTGSDNNFIFVETLYKLKATNCYPNPVKDILQIDLETSVSSFNFSVFSMAGKLIERKNSDNLRYNASKLSTGNYLLSIRNSRGEILGVTKFIKK